MASIVFPFYPDGITQELDAYETGVTAPPAAPKISSVANFNTEGTQFDQPGPWLESATTRYMTGLDATALKIRMYRSLDSSATWAEVDAAHAPSINNDNVINDIFYGCVRDTRPATTKVYVAFWDTDATVSVKPFNFTTNLWEATIKSGLTWLNGGADMFTGFSVAFRATDNTVVIGACLNLLQHGNSFEKRSYFTKCNVLTGIFDGAWTPFGNPLVQANNLGDNIRTTVSGGYTAGSGILNVASTAAPFPQNANAVSHMSVYILDQNTGAIKANLGVLTLASATRWTVIASGLDANCVDGDIVVISRHWASLGMVTDDVDRIHCQFYVIGSNVGPTYLYHQVLHTDNTLSVSDLVQSIDNPNALTSGFCRPLARPIPAGGTELLFGYMRFVAAGPKRTPFVARGTAGDAPAWTYEQLLTEVTGTNPWEGFALVNLLNGQVGAYFIQADTSNNTAVFASMTNDGPGLGWSAPVTFANIAWNQTAQSGITSYFTASYGASTPAPPAVTYVARITPYYIVLPNNCVKNQVCICPNGKDNVRIQVSKGLTHDNTGW